MARRNRGNTKLEIIHTALNLFMQVGYSNTYTSKIAKEIGISNGNLMFHFHTKEHLLAELINMLCDFQWEVMEREVEDGKSSLLAYLLEIATIASICDENPVAKDLYVSAYIHPMSLEIIRKNDTRKAKKVFTKYCEGWKESDFIQAENMATGIRTYTCTREGCEDSYTETIPKLTSSSSSSNSGTSTNPPSTEESGTEEPGTEESGTEESGTEETDKEEPDTENPEEDTVEWKNDDTGIFYEKEDGTRAVGWYEMTEDNWYYFDENGYRQTGWLKEGETWYYLNENGAMQTGWLKEGETWYYLRENGAMQTGWIQIGSDWFYLNKNGAMASNTYIGKWYVDKNGYYIPS